jgi:hypothetical protein
MTEQKMSPAAKEHAHWIARALAAEAELVARQDKSDLVESLSARIDALTAERDAERRFRIEDGMDKGRLQVALAAAEAERDALLPIKESWSQLKRELDEVRAERNALAVDLRQCRTRPVVTQLVAAEAERDRCWNALRKIADSGCSLALGGGKPTCRESMPDPRDSWDWCTRCVAAHALAPLTEPEEK